MYFKIYCAQIEILRVRFPVASIRLERIIYTRVYHMRVLTRRERVHSRGAVTLRLNLGFESFLVGVPRTHRRIMRGCASSRMVRNVSLSRTARQIYSVLPIRIRMTICVSARRMTKRFEGKK